MQLVVRDPALEDEAVLRSRIESLGLKVLDISSLGSIRQMIVKASEEEAKEKLSAISPELVESVPLTLEEIFIYELEARGYGSAELTKEDS